MFRLRTLTGLTALALVLAGCGAPASDGTETAPAAATPIFVEPSSPAAADPPAALTAPSPTPAKPSVTPKPKAKTSTPATPKNVKYVFPVKASNVAYHPTHGKYPATDIFADCGESVVAATSGVVLEVSRKDSYVKGSPDGPNNGGLSVSLLGDDGVRYYGSHFSKVQSAIKAGVRVTAGQLLGQVGRTGNANNVCHLHFGISPPCARTGDWKTRRGVVWPATFLDSWRKKGGKSPVATVKAWEKKNHCKP
ncbi:M23 family metallopeptidase [Actinoplanes sp. NPDC089786]|uniref:M23 family metallopeptidase n=1 Tax=Actinoplanes sp. NPDC089786 TaxID=3155185 RepID=UPI00343F9B8B